MIVIGTTSRNGPLYRGHFFKSGRELRGVAGREKQLLQLKKLRNEQAIQSTLPTFFLLSTTGTAKAAVGSTRPARRCERQRDSAQPHVLATGICLDTRAVQAHRPVA